MSAKRHRWVLRIAVDIDGGLTTANVALEEIDKVVAVIEAAGYLVLDKRGICSPVPGPDEETKHDA